MKTLLDCGLGLAAMLLLCLLPMPYGYYHLVRFLAMVFFAALALASLHRKKELAIASGVLALLFQPFLKVSLGRPLWQFVDVLVALALIGLWKINRNRS